MRTPIKISLSQDRFALIDAEDFGLTSGFRWYFSGGYAKSDKIVGKKRIRFRLHRLIMGSPPDKEIDHINGDTLDNRRENLRICTHAENSRNRKVCKRNKSGFRGVSHFRDKWQASIRFNGKSIHLGHRKTKEEAAMLYENAAKKLFGAYVRQQE